MSVIILLMTIFTVDKGEYDVTMKFDSMRGCEYFANGFKENGKVTGYVKHSCKEEIK